MGVGGRILAVIRPISPVVAEIVNVLGLGLAATSAGVGDRSTLGTCGRAVLNAVIPTVVFSFGLTAFGILTGASVSFSHFIVYPITEVTGVRSLIRSRRVEIYASLCIMGIVIAAVFIGFIVNPFAAFKIVIVAYHK